MDNKKFTNIGKKQFRNILNINQINEDFEKFIKNKNLEKYPNIITWIKTVVKNYALQKMPLNLVEKENLNEEIQKLINNKNILPPYHILNISAEFKDKISHCIDYLISSFEKEKDLNRISFEQAQINAQLWLVERLKKLSSDDDIENVQTVKEITYKNNKYRWVNIKSHKALQYESKLMNNCIETYWDKNYPNTKIISEDSQFYSLRDIDNKPIISLYRENYKEEYYIKNKINKKQVFLVGEIKEKNNQYLSHEYRPLVDELLKDKNVEFIPEEKELSHYYHSVREKGDYENNDLPIKSINQIIENRLTFISNNTLNIEEFENYFEKEKLYAINNWEKLSINGIDNEKFSMLSANEIKLKDIEDKEIRIESLNFYCKNINKSKIKIDNYHATEKKNKAKFITRVFENLNDCHVIIESKSSHNEWYIFKNCHNIKLKSHKTISNNNSNINIIKIDSPSIELDLSQTKNILNITENTYKYLISSKSESVSGDNNDHRFENVENKINRNKFFTKALNLYLNLYNWDNKENSVFENYLNQLEFKSKEFQGKSEFYIYEDLIENNIQSLLNNTFRNSQNYFKNQFEKFEQKQYKEYEKFIEENAYSILKLDLQDNFDTAKEKIELLQENIERYLLKNRELLIETLNNKKDNFSEYMYRVFFETDSPVELLRHNELLIYLFKNEIMKQVVENVQKDNPYAYRFALTEKRLTKTSGKKWIDYITDEKLSFQYKKVLQNILISPYDNNKLMNCLENKNTINVKEIKSTLKLK